MTATITVAPAARCEPRCDHPATHIDVIRSEQHLRELEPDWSELLAQSERDTVFLTHAWHMAWWECFGEGKLMHVLTARQDGRLVAIAPLCTESTTFRGVPVRRLSFMANGQTCESGFLVRRGDGRAIGAMLDHLTCQRALWNWMDLRRVPADSSDGLIGTAADVGLRTLWRHDLRVPYIPIRGTWQEFLAGRSRNFRRARRHHDNRMAGDGRVFRVERLIEQPRIQATLPDVVDIIRRSWKGGDSRRQIEHRFDQALVNRLGPLGQVNLWLLRCQGRPIAFEFHLVYRGVTAALRAGFDQSFARLSPGAYLERQIIRLLFDNPASDIVEYNTCADNYDYTRRWTDDVRDYTRIWFFRRGWLGGLLAVLGLLGRSASLPSRLPTLAEPS